jgi:Tfp pilus assembly protein PilN
MRPVLTVRVGAGSARAELTRGARVLWAAESAYSSPDELRDAIAQLTAGESMPVRAPRLRVELGPPLAQVRTLHGLPPVRAGHLKALVANQAGRFFRRNGKPLVTDAAWLRGKRRGGVAFAAAAEEPWIAAMLEGAAAGGGEVESIRPSGGPAGVRLGLLSVEERRRRWRRELVALGRLAAIAAMTWSAAVAVWGVRFERERRAVNREIERLRAPAEAIGSARRALGVAAELVDSVETAGRNRARTLEQLAGLSAAMPDSAYATSLALDEGGGGELAVVARRSSEVAAALERVGAIATPRIEGTVVREVAAGREWERFTVRFDAVPFDAARPTPAP